MNVPLLVFGTFFILAGLLLLSFSRDERVSRRGGALILIGPLPIYIGSKGHTLVILTVVIALLTLFAFFAVQQV